MAERKLERVSVEQAAKELDLDPLTLRYSLRDGTLPIGFAQKRKRYVYVIYRNLLDTYKKGLWM